MILWQCCNKTSDACRYWKYFTVCFASSYLFVVISTALSYIWTWLVCRLNSVNAVNAESSWYAHARTHNENSVCSHSCEVHSVFLQLHNILIWSHEPAHVCVQSWIRFVFMRPGWHTYCFSYLSFQSSFLAWAVACLYSPLLVCVKGCDKRACMLGIKVVSVLQCWLADLLLRKKWHRSKQELEPSRSVCVSVCFLCFLLIPLLALSFLSPGGLLSTLRYLHVFLHDCSVDYSDVAGSAVRSLCGLLPLNSSYLKYGVCIGRFGFNIKKNGGLENYSVERNSQICDI